MARRVQFGSRELEFPGRELGELVPGGSLQEDGYLLLRGVLPREDVLAARRRLVSFLEERHALLPGSDPMVARRRADAPPLSVSQLRELGCSPEVAAVVESDRLVAFFEDHFGSPVLAYTYKWLRAIAPGAFTGAHFDAVYMGRGTRRVRTVWIPFGDVSVELGTPVICEGSHRLASFRALRESYGALDVDRDKIADTGWYTEDPLEVTERLGGAWKTADFRAGDALVFGLHVMHASTTNVTDCFRLSGDVRFQPASEPADERWTGNEPVGHTAFGVAGPGTTTVEELRRKWEG